MDMTPTSSTFKMITGASIAYGLTEGGYNATNISITDLATRILSPVTEGQDHVAKREAFLKPRVISEFMNRYDGSPIPKENIAQNVLVEMGVPRDRAPKFFELIVKGALDLSLISEIKGKKSGNLSNTSPSNSVNDTSLNDNENVTGEDINDGVLPTIEVPTHSINKEDDIGKLRRVMVTHGKNSTFVEPIKKLLKFGELEAVVSVEMQSVSKPVPDKVMDDMRSCGAAIIHVDNEQTMMDKDAKEIVVLNPNVLIEIGAAMALYKRKFILLVREGVALPSNLQGLYEVRYSGDTLDGDATIRLLEAINQLKSERA